MRCKQSWLDVAEVIDSLRIFTRLLVAGYGAWVVWFIDRLWNWYQTLPAEQRSAQVTIVIGSVSGGVFGLAAYIAKIYIGTGRDWNVAETTNSTPLPVWNRPDNKDPEQ